MAVFTYEDVTPSLIENTLMQKMIRDGVHVTYTIRAVDGYVLHDKRNDWEDMDENGDPVLMLGYAIGTVTCAASYDFETNPWEFYAVPEDSVPADQIFGVGNQTEIM